MNTKDFERSKIFEKLKYTPEPPNYHNKIPWVVQQQIAATNGIHYVDLIGKLKKFPNYEIPIKKVKNGIMLDIGNGWGRWLIAGAKKGYIPIGIDFRYEFCDSSIKNLKYNKLSGYSIVADLKSLPFKENIFDFVWSFSVIQHTHYDRLKSCLHHINRILNHDGKAKLEFPNLNGIRNYFKHVKNEHIESNNYNSWNVRYYSIKKYKSLFLEYFKNFNFETHSFLGIGILKDDLKYVSFKNKIFVFISLISTFISKNLPFLKYFSDSIYINVYKKSKTKENNQKAIQEFLTKHSLNPNDNLNILPLLQCPITGEDLHINNDRTLIISNKSKITYPIINDIPVLVESQSFITK